MARNVALLGMMGAGKSTVARALGTRLQRTVVETDADIERAAGRPIREIVAADGEAALRALEREAVARAAAHHDRVIALGGGAPLDDDNVAALRDTSVLVYLDCAPAVLAQRLGRTPIENRPLLDGSRGADLERRLGDLVGARRDRYEDVADHRVDASGQPDDVVDLIVAWARGNGDVLTAAELDRLGR